MLAEILTLSLAPVSLLLRRRSLSETELRAFCGSWEWKRLRYEAIKRYGRRCSACGATGRIVVDHIKPVWTHPICG
jgi:5-methylcytosine-specific restriction endonuclease McrA